MNDILPASIQARIFPNMTISKRLDIAMREAGFKSQSSLHRASGVPQPTINRILKGAGTKGPETETLKKLAVACNVNFDWLNEGRGEKSRNANDSSSSITSESATPNQVPQPSQGAHSERSHLSPAAQKLIEEIIAAEEHGTSSPQLIEALTKVLHVALPATASNHDYASLRDAARDPQ